LIAAASRNLSHVFDEISQTFILGSAEKTVIATRFVVIDCTLVAFLVCARFWGINSFGMINDEPA
jgi:hypothetical protein